MGKGGGLMVRGEIEWAAPTGQGKIAVPGNKITALVRRSMGKYLLNVNYHSLREINFIMLSFKMSIKTYCFNLCKEACQQVLVQ